LLEHIYYVGTHDKPKVTNLINLQENRFMEK
jgi:hypothetical protein